MVSRKLKLILTFALLLLLSKSFSQEQRITITCQDTVMGKNLLTGEDIPGRKMIFSQHITTMLDLDYSGNILLTLHGLNKLNQTKSKGILALYEPGKSHIIWKRPYKTDKNRMMPFPGILFFEDKYEFYKIDYLTGANQWKLKYVPYFIDNFYHIGLGYRLDKYGGRAHNMEAFDLDKGTTVWTRKIDKSTGWNDAFYLNDSLLMIIASGLHTVDISNGKGWDYALMTGKDYASSSEIAGAIVGGIIGGLIGGAIAGAITRTSINMATGLQSGLYAGLSVIGRPYNDPLYWNLGSNLLLKENLYFASTNTVCCLDKNNGDLIWSSELPRKKASKSSLFLADNILYMVNYGCGLIGNELRKYGTPFFSAFNADNGEMLFFSPIKSKTDYILDYRIEENTIILLLRNSIQRYDLSSGELLLSVEINGYNLRFFTDDLHYLRTPDNSFVKVIDSDPLRYFIFTDKNDIVVCNDQFKVEKLINLFQLYSCRQETERYRFIVRNNQTFILDSDNRKIAEIPASGNAILIGNKLYDFGNNILFETDLTKLFEGE